MATGGRKIMLAIDLGRRVGISVIDSSGSLLRYGGAAVAKRHGPSWDTHALTVLRGYPDSVTQTVGTQAGKGAPEWMKRRYVESGDTITHLAMEGTKGREEWVAAAKSLSPEDAEIEVIDVEQSAWREQVLLPEESATRIRAQEASRWIARQVVADMGEGLEPAGPMEHNIAQSVLIGRYTAEQLGWRAKSEPPVRREPSGMVSLPHLSAMERVEIALEDGIGAVLELARSGDAEVQELAVATLAAERCYQLRMDTTGRDVKRAIAYEAIPILTSTMCSGSATAKERAARVLRKFAVFSEYRSAVAECVGKSEAMPVLTGLAGGAGDDAIAATRALEHLRRYSPEL